MEQQDSEKLKQLKAEIKIVIENMTLNRIDGTGADATYACFVSGEAADILKKWREDVE